MPDRPPSLAWAEEVLNFWFMDLSADAWFRRDEALDSAMRTRFASLRAALAARPPRAVDLSPRETVAAVIVLDQFPRNMYRDTAAAFASDPQALALAEEAVDLGHDRRLDGPRAREERLFLYLPFEHSERLADQHRAVALIGALGVPEFTRYAVAHLKIIERFGRFPHRNAALGRTTTAEEAQFLLEPDSRF